MPVRLHEVPNIIFVHTDSMDGRAMGCMGHPALVGATPNIDRLARRGVLFRNAYSNDPICCPSRASMLSGRYTHHCEAWNNYKGLEPTDRMLFDDLRDAGYRTSVLGKTDYLSGSHTVRARVSAWTRSANVMRPNYRMGPPRVLDTDERHVRRGDWRDLDAAIRWIQEEGARQPEPFFLWMGIRAPHPDFVTSRHYLDLIDPSNVDIPKPDGYTHPVLEYQRVNKNWMHGFDDETVRLVRRIYFAMIAEVDGMVGELVGAIEDCGLGDSTCVVFSSDHGELAMEHRQFYKMSPYEASVRVPLVVAGPGVQQGVAIDTPVSLVDVYPTLMDLIGAPRPDGLDGHSLMPELTGKPTEHPGWALSEYHDTSCSTGMLMLRGSGAQSAAWKYVAYVGYPSQLFNLDEDPDELHDYAPEHPDIVREMDRRLREIVDYEAVDRKVKAYDRASFRQWRQEQLAAGTYRAVMARIFSGWDDLRDGEGDPWTDEEERGIEDWLGMGG